MKRFFVYLFSLLLAACGGSKIKPADDLGNKAALAEIRKEKKVKEAILTGANVFYVSVEDDGTIRNGLAEYFAQILIDNKASSKWVKVVEFGTTGEKYGYGKVLGEAKITN